MLAERYNDGSITPRDENKALKWAVISTLLSNGIAADLDTDYLRYFKNNLPPNAQEKAQKTAKLWAKVFHDRPGEND